MQRREVHTVFLQTGNYASRGAIFRPRAAGRLLAAAHARNIHVVAWYVPGFKDLERDIRRVRAALRFRARGQRFDSFALDIEATQVADIARRNARVTHLAKHLDRFAADAYPLGAIVPEAHARYWPNFPYRAMGERFDIFLPMAYFTYRTSGRARVFRFTSENMREIRSRTQDPKVPIHPIGGLAGKAAPDDVAGFVSAARKHDAIGASLYDFKLMQPREWRRLRDSFGR